jgi:hypothetical protein
MIEDVSIHLLLNTEERAKVDKLSFVAIWLKVVMVLDRRINTMKLVWIIIDSKKMGPIFCQVNNNDSWYQVIFFLISTIQRWNGEKAALIKAATPMISL